MNVAAGGVVSRSSEVTRTESRRVAAGGAKPIDVIFLLDASGSMSGGPMADCKAAVDAIWRNLRPNDSLAVYSFGSQQPLLRMHVHLAAKWKQEKHDSFKNGMKSMSADAGRTALWDAIVEIGEVCLSKKPRQAHGRVTKLVVLTDGGDNASKSKWDDAAAALWNPGMVLHVVLISAGHLDRTGEHLAEIADKKKHIKYVAVDDHSGILSAFRTAAQWLKIEVTETVRTVRTVQSGGPARGGGGFRGGGRGEERGRGRGRGRGGLRGGHGGRGRGRGGLHSGGRGRGGYPRVVVADFTVA